MRKRKIEKILRKIESKCNISYTTFLLEQRELERVKNILQGEKNG